MACCQSYASGQEAEIGVLKVALRFSMVHVIRRQHLEGCQQVSYASYHICNEATLQERATNTVQHSAHRTAALPPFQNAQPCEMACREGICFLQLALAINRMLRRSKT